MEDWGIRIGDEKVVEKTILGVKVGENKILGLTATGRELYVSKFGKHPITEKLKNMAMTLYLPRPVEPLPAAQTGGADRADKPQVTVLAESSREGWAETDFDQNPPRFDRGVDRPGPLSVAVAAEKGPGAGIDVQLHPTRLVVAGDSEFCANGSLSGGNQDFFMSALGWLLERQELMGIAPKVPGLTRLELSPPRDAFAFAIMVVLMPACVALTGVAVWLRRKR